jgi:hypothetical protein
VTDTPTTVAEFQTRLSEVADERNQWRTIKNDLQRELDVAQRDHVEAVQQWETGAKRVTTTSVIKQHINHEQEMRAKRMRGEIAPEPYRPHGSVIDAIAAMGRGGRDGINVRGGRSFARLPRRES